MVEEAAREPAGAGANGLAAAALELWRGAPLADVASEPFAGPEIGRLEELHLRAIELAIDAELAAGRHAEAIARLEALIAEEPLRERLHAQRMLALYRDGRQSEALDAYREARETLIEQIGVEPGPELKRLQEQILAQDPSLDAPPPIVELPVQLEGGSPLLAGRERELRWLRTRWGRAREGRVVCVMVWGPSGIGKTRLVAELAAEVQREGAAVLYTGGGELAEGALATVAEAATGHRPTLLVLDYADDAPPSVLEAAAALAREPEGRSLMVCVLHHDEQGPPAFAALLESGAAQRLRLDPLGEDAAAEIAALYARRGRRHPHADTARRERGGAASHPPRRRRAGPGRRWPSGSPRRRAGRPTISTELRATQAAVAGGVVDLQTASERTRLYAVEEPPDPSEPAVCPFRGLAPFDAAHAEYFFGRERLVAELVARLVGSTLLAVVGPSGSGKSSAVRAGLLPALADGVVPGSESWRRAVMRPGERPLAELSRALARAVPEAGGEDAAPWIADALDRLEPGERLVLLIDQFEEAFVACRDQAEREAFFDALVEGAGDPDERLVVVLAIRGDFYARCAEHAELSTLVSANQVLVGPMRRDELRRAIELPSRRAGLRIEPGLVSALVGDVAGEPGGLPLLSAALRRALAAARRPHPALRGLRAKRRRQAARSRALPRTPTSASVEAERLRARAMLLRLAGAEDEAGGGVRSPPRSARRARARARPGRRPGARRAHRGPPAHGRRGRRRGRPRGAASRVAAPARLARRGRRGPPPSPAPDRRRRASGATPGATRPSSTAAPGSPRRSTGPPSHDPELNELERAFLDESRAASERAGRAPAARQPPPADAARRGRRAARRRDRRRGDRALRAPGRAQRGHRRRRRAPRRPGPQPRSASTRRCGSRAPALALDDSVATRSSLLSTLLRSPAAIGVLTPTGEELPALALSPDGETLAASDADGTVTLFDTDTYEVVGEHQAPGTAYAIAFDPQGDSLAVASTPRPSERPRQRERWRFSTRLPGGCAARPRLAASAPGQGFAHSRHRHLRSGRTKLVRPLHPR